MTVVFATSADVIDPLPVIVTIALLLAVLVAMVVSWRRRSGRQRGYLAPGAAGDSGLPGLAIEGLYLATTFAGRPLDRVVVGGLGFRSRATITVTAHGARIERDGAEPFFLAASRLVGAGVATWTIDRAVEKNGLTVIAWRLDRTDGGADEVESAFRIDLEPRADLIAAVRSLVQATGARTEEHGADVD
ncbi:hypothetical protein [uncultured Amnibacterium sp.]|uniref:PH-like domain-containing protein n=1 Tax=uncultured Amnibacterium sp. TaxID=1631851 RepID=UPI0035C9AB96